MEFESDMSGICRVESYTIVYRKGAPDRVVIVVRSEDGVRGLAQSAAGDAATIADALRVDPLGRDVELAPGPGGTNSFRFVPFTSTSAG